MVEPDPVRTQRKSPSSSVEDSLADAGFASAVEIGRGGFGVVYRCRQVALDRTVAVKLLTTGVDNENRERFLREQRAMGRLTGHPNVVNVFEVGVTDSGHPYLVMQYFEYGSLHNLIARTGPLSMPRALGIGVRVAGALETAHRLGILHRDVKPANILLDDYGEAALTDFGIAHFAGAFETSSGVVTGTPAFTPPEVLRGESPTAASDVYALASTVFSALTGHVAFERRQGEEMIAHFVRITNDPLPDLRARGIPADVAAVIERAMSTSPADRHPSAAAFGDELRELEHRHGLHVDAMALHVESNQGSVPLTAAPTTSGVHRIRGDLPISLSRFIGREAETASARELLSSNRLVVFTGMGGVGKTRLALHVAGFARPGFADGAWFVELGDLSDESLLQSLVVTALGMRKETGTPDEALIEFLAARQALLVFDNCERVVDAVAKLGERILRACPDVKIMATSRHTFGIDGEAVLRVPALTLPAEGSTVSDASGYDALRLFSERAVAAVPGFRLNDDNITAVVAICRRLDGIPLPIELAAARLRVMTPQQILDGISENYSLLTRGSRTAPTRQQTVRGCIDWSYDLCTERERLLWARLSVFAGAFEFDAAQAVCGKDFEGNEVLDLLTSLIEKSILIREQHDGAVRFRLTQILREYGSEKIHGEYAKLAELHRNWYLGMVTDARADWMGPRQLEWISRIELEQPNIRDALDCCIADDTRAALTLSVALYPYWSSRGLYSEGRRWLDRVLASTDQATTEQIPALCASSVLAGWAGDLELAASRIVEIRSATDDIGDPSSKALANYAEGLYAAFSGDHGRSRALLESAVAYFRTRGDDTSFVESLGMLGMSYEQLGELDAAATCYEEALALTESRGESVGRGYTLWAMAVLECRRGYYRRARTLLRQSLVLLAKRVADPYGSAICLEVSAWIACEEGHPDRAAVLIEAAGTVGRSVCMWPTANVEAGHHRCKATLSSLLSSSAFDTAAARGRTLQFDEAVEFALEDVPPRSA